MAVLMIRNLDPDLESKLKDMAAQAERSKEAEARMAIRQWVHGGQSSKWQEEITSRIRTALDLAASPTRKRLQSDYTITPAKLAQGIGEDYVSPVEGWIEGSKEPSLSQIEKIARWCRVDVNWLMYGEGVPFRAESTRIPENPGEGALWLLAEDEDRATTLKALRLLRVEGQRGEFLLMRHYENGDVQVFTTPYVIPGNLEKETGSGGRASLKNILLIFQILYSIYTKSDRVPGLIISSHIITGDIDSRLRQGWEHPLALMEGLRPAPWWEDIWDKDQFSRTEYWPGWKAVCAELNADLDDDKWSSGIRRRIAHFNEDRASLVAWLQGNERNLQPLMA